MTFLETINTRIAQLDSELGDIKLMNLNTGNVYGEMAKVIELQNALIMVKEDYLKQK